MKWEYLVVFTNTDDAKEQEHLNKLGLYGWKLVAVYGHRLYLRRPLVQSN